jgi:hypothetical protein
MTERALRDRSSGSGSSSAETSQTPTADQATTSQPEQELGDPAVPAATLTVNAARVRVIRGERLDVSGRVTAAAALCDHARVDLWLVREANERHALGTLMTDDLGRFAGGMVVPYSVPVGDYAIEAVTPGRSPLCGPGRSN